MLSANELKMARVIGSICVCIGVVLNPILAEPLLASDGEIESNAVRSILSVLSLLGVASGLILLFTRSVFIVHTAVNVSLLIVAVASTLAVAEITIRVLPGIGLPTPLPLFMPNATGTGSHRVRPDLAETRRVEGKLYTVRTNSNGMHWREVPRQPSDGRTRVAVLGDSFVFGLWADSFATSLVGVLETALDDPSVEILNFGVGGYSFADMRLYLEEEVLAFRPDYILVCAFNGNDYRDTFLGLDKWRIEGGRLVVDSALFVQRIPAELRPDPEATLVWGFFLPQLQIFQLLREVIDIRRETGRSFASSFVPSRSFYEHSFWSRQPVPEITRRAVDMSLVEIARMYETTVATGAVFALASLPYREQVYATNPVGSDYDTGLPQRFLEEFARERGIPHFDLLPIFREAARSRERLYMQRDIHFNNAGHFVAGEALAGFLRDSVFPKTHVPSPSVSAARVSDF